MIVATKIYKHFKLTRLKYVLKYANGRACLRYEQKRPYFSNFSVILR